jgi:predicted metal-dependent hydrolase
MDAHLRAGVAVYDDGHYHAAHDAWEDYWLNLESGTDDERLLHGLIQFTAAVHHGYHGNWEGLRGLAESGAGYLDGLPDGYRGVNVADVRAYLRQLAADPEHVERAGPLALTYEGEALALADLDLDAALVAAPVLAEDDEAYDDEVVERAVEYARADLEAGDDASQFITLVLDFVRDADRRDLVYQHLAAHVSKRRGREEDVEGLFD